MEERPNGLMKTVQTEGGIERVNAECLNLARRLQSLPNNRIHLVLVFRAMSNWFVCVLTGAGIKLERLTK